MNDGFDSTLRQAVSLRSVRRAGVMSPAKATAGFDQFARVVGVDVLHLVVRGEKLPKTSLYVVRVVMTCRIGHDGASELVENDQGIFVAMPTRSVVLCKNDVVGSESVGESFWNECFVGCVVVSWLRWSVFVVASAAGCVLYHRPCADLTIGVFGRVSLVV